MVSSFGDRMIGYPVIYLETVESTNQYAAELISKNNPIEGTAIIAAHQTHGKGQIGRSWISEPHQNLILSVILKPGFLPLESQFYLNMMSALAISSLIESFVGSGICIKWPNDIYYGNKKIAGILIQNQIAGKKITYSIIGMGLNINQERFPPEIKNPISLKIATCQTFEINQLTSKLFDALEHYYKQLKASSKEKMKTEYLSKLYRMNIPAAYTDLEGIGFEGIIRGIRENGELIMEVNGRQRIFQFNGFSYNI